MEQRKAGQLYSIIAPDVQDIMAREYFRIFQLHFRENKQKPCRLYDH